MTEQTIPQVNIPKDLQDSYNAAKSLSLVHDVLLKGSFNYTELHRVPIALGFIKALHEQTTEALINHPQSDLIEEIKIYKESINGSKKDSNKDSDNYNNGASVSTGSEASSTL